MDIEELEKSAEWKDSKDKNENKGLENGKVFPSWWRTLRTLLEMQDKEGRKHK